MYFFEDAKLLFTAETDEFTIFTYVT